jgi:hypothetical protein
MKQAYRHLLTVYPPHIRSIYGQEMVLDFEARFDRCDSMLSRIRFCAGSIVALLIDAIVQRLWTLGSHPSFSGRRPADLSVVRPPNMGKGEWFRAT